MATFFKNKVVKEIGKVNVPIYEVGPSARATDPPDCSAMIVPAILQKKRKIPKKERAVVWKLKVS